MSLWFLFASIRTTDTDDIHRHIETPFFSDGHVFKGAHEDVHGAAIWQLIIQILVLDRHQPEILGS